MTNKENTFTEALVSYINDLGNKSKIICTDDENRVGLYEYEAAPVKAHTTKRRKKYAVCTATQAEKVNLQKHIYLCKTFDDYAEAYKYYCDGCKKVAYIFGRESA